MSLREITPLPVVDTTDTGTVEEIREQIYEATRLPRTMRCDMGDDEFTRYRLAQRRKP